MKSLKKMILGQHYTGVWIGTARSLFSNAQFYMGVVNFGLIAILAYDGSFGETLRGWFPWLNFGLYFSFFVVGYLFVMLFEWKIVTPSIMAMSNWMSYQSTSRARRDLKQVHNELKEIREQLVKLGGDPIEVGTGEAAPWTDAIDKWQRDSPGGW